MSAALLAELRDSPLTLGERVPGASNVTVLARTGEGTRCVYKPRAGERELWDFPSGTLAEREVATFEMDLALGWNLVPPTVIRADGPLGPGMCQLYVEAVGEPPVALIPQGNVPVGWCVAASGDGYVLMHRDSVELRRMVLLDAITANTDRKGGHLLPVVGSGVFGIDHGVTFSVEDKLRTVLWGFAGQEIGGSEQADLEALLEHWPSAAEPIAGLLSAAEVDAARERLTALVTLKVFPLPQPGWPRLPWPVM